MQTQATLDTQFGGESTNEPNGGKENVRNRAESTETELEDGDRRTGRKTSMATILARMGESNPDADLRTIGRRVTRLREEGLLLCSEGR